MAFHASKKNLLLDPDEILIDSVSVLSEEHLERRIERPLNQFSSIFFLILITGTVGYFGFRAVSLQVRQGNNFFYESQENRFFVRPLFAPRGIFYDRNRVPLVDNVASFTLIFEKKSFTQKQGALEPLLAQLKTLLGRDEEFFFDAGFPRDYTLQNLPSRFIIIRDIPRERIIALIPYLDRLPGIEITESYRRVYKDPFAYAHVLGYIGKISDADIKKNLLLRDEEVVGREGIEAFYDEKIRGAKGKKIIEIDSEGRETRFRLTQEPKHGSPLLLALDAGLQEKSYEMLEHYIHGVHSASVIAIDPKTSAVRALVSYPSFDNNRFSSSLTAKEFSAILENPLKPLFNRAISGEFPAGSTFKPLLAAAALEEKIIDPNKKIFDAGFIEIPNPYKPEEMSIFKDWKQHGWINFYDAIALSANVYFYMIGGGYQDQAGLGIDRIKRYAGLFGFGSRLGIDIPGEQTGFIPDPAAKAALEPKNPQWRVGDTYNVSIGQGGVRVTPLQMTALTAALANGGTMYQPHLVTAILDDRGNEVIKITPRIIHTQAIKPENIHEVIKGMRQTVTGGTARLLQEVPVSLAAKTGTAQAGSGKPHAWVTAFGPFENPELAITVMVEHAGEGSTVAVPIMRDILKWYFEKR